VLSCQFVNKGLAPESCIFVFVWAFEGRDMQVPSIHACMHLCIYLCKPICICAYMHMCMYIFIMMF
jgi:hypothetical protein